MFYIAKTFLILGNSDESLLIEESGIILRLSVDKF